VTVLNPFIRYCILALGLASGMLVSDWVQASEWPQIQKSLQSIQQAESYPQWRNSPDYPATWLRNISQTDLIRVCQELGRLRNDDLAIFQSILKNESALPCKDKFRKKLEASFSTINTFASLADSKTNLIFGQKDLVIPSWSDFLKNQDQWIRSGEWVIVFVGDLTQPVSERISQSLSNHRIHVNFIDESHAPEALYELAIDSEDWKISNPSRWMRGMIQKMDASEKGVLIFRSELEQTSALFSTVLDQLQKRRVRIISLSLPD